MLAYLKAIVGAVIAGLGVLALALEDGAVAPNEWVNIAIATLTAFTAVWVTPNIVKDKPLE